MAVAAGTLAVTGDYRLQSQSGNTFGASAGLLTMTNPADRVVVTGDFVTDSALNHNGNLTEGTLELKGDFTQLSTNAPNDPAARYNFLTSSNHRLLLTGGTDQHFSFTNPDNSPLTRLELLSNPAARVVFDTRTVVTVLFDHHQRSFQLAPDALVTDFPDADGDGIRDPLEAFPVGDLDNNGVPDNATTENYSYDAWAALFFWQGDPNLAQISAPNADPDLDGVPNALEYVMATLPMRANTPRYELSVTETGGAPHLALTFPLVKVSAGSITTSVVASANLRIGSWVATGAVPTVLSDDGQVQVLRIVDPLPVSQGAPRFLAILGQRVGR
jgi:hypothetical protein